jgi:hypothetical protein
MIIPKVTAFGADVDWRSPTLQAHRIVGDCLFPHGERFGFFFIDRALPIRPGDAGDWEIPALPERQRFGNAKWLIDVDGVEWLACKYFATRRSHYQVARGRIVAHALFPAFWRFLRPINNESAELMKQMADLRADPPSRPDVVVFPEDLVDHDAIWETIRRHRDQWQHAIRPTVSQGALPALQARLRAI